MKHLRALLAVAALFAAALAVTVNPALAGLVVVAAVVSILMLAPITGQLRATLTGTEILMDIMDAFKLTLPSPFLMATDFSTTPLIKDKKYTAHIASLPTTATPDDTNGYANGVQEAQSLLTDVEVTVSNIKSVPLRWKHLSLIAESKKEYASIIASAGHVLAKAMVDDLFAGMTAANFSQSITYATNDCDSDMAQAATAALNLKKAGPNRFLVLNTPAATTYASDSRTGSKDFNGQLTGGIPYRRWRNIDGFAEVFEYPDLPGNSENLVGFAGDARAFAILAGPPETQSDLARELGITEVMRWDSVTDPDTGLTMSAATWQQPGKGDLYFVPVLLWGYKAGKQASGNAAGTAADYAGLRVKSA